MTRMRLSGKFKKCSRPRDLPIFISSTEAMCQTFERTPIVFPDLERNSLYTVACIIAAFAIFFLPHRKLYQGNMCSRGYVSFSIHLLIHESAMVS